jgi:hypothetical protein
LSLPKNAEKRMYPARRTGSSVIYPEAIWTTMWWARLAPVDMLDTNVQERSTDLASQGSASERSQEKNIAESSTAAGRRCFGARQS